MFSVLPNLSRRPRTTIEFFPLPEFLHEQNKNVFKIMSEPLLVSISTVSVLEVRLRIMYSKVKFKVTRTRER